jgi:hypothetical protein
MHGFSLFEVNGCPGREAQPVKNFPAEELSFLDYGQNPTWIWIYGFVANHYFHRARREVQRSRKNTDLGIDRGVGNVPRNKISVPDKASDEISRRGIINIFRRADLLQFAIADHRDPIRHAQGLFLIVGYQDRCGAQAVQNFSDFPAHLRAEVRVQPVEGLVEKHHPWTGRQSTRQSDPLLLAP